MKPDPTLYAVILSGGRGERFWPVGRHARPKQFVDVFGGKPLLAHAVDRLAGLVDPAHILVLTSRDLVAATRKALPALSPRQVLGEPEGRDTAAACALATAWVSSLGGPDATMVILPADHLIAREAAFRDALAKVSTMVSREPVLGLLGIEPTFPSTAYGYIEAGAPRTGRGASRGFRSVARFAEKPTRKVAAAYVAKGTFFWNSGMFAWRVRTFEAALRVHRPALAKAVFALAPRFGTRGFARALAAAYRPLEKISVDYAVMEKADNLVLLPVNIGWDDVGTWSNAHDHLRADADGNAVHGAATLLAAHGNTVVNTHKGHLVAVYGADNLVVVHTADATLVCTREAAADLKALVRTIPEDKR